ncbi:lamin tail domain-containing protein [Pinibacter soli]|uniref:Lamin tail domain-containing protein n=1 Tax=Pinibacter soli TaxID=3044211 RepID=A0ABT6R8J7_9BACT|nr:lamin tail domain-containing protein [Pinibacter soli]MDI3318880.1 lamin tail domain-containing protein [Pinibacter soli]
MKFFFTAVAMLFLNYASYAQAKRFDILITEIMPIPSPVVGLPPAKYVEIKNASPTVINLKNWKLCSANSAAAISQSVLLKPDSFLLICTSSNLAALSTIAPTISVTNFPTLYADGDEIFLLSPEGKTIHSVSYSRSWFNDIKSKGGWSLEMIDTQNPCGGASNWTASINDKGGTPGKENSVKAVNIDNTAPQLLKAFASDEKHITLVFNEPVDSIQASVKTNYMLNDNAIASVVVKQPSFTNVILEFTNSLTVNRPYDFSLSNIEDCSGNTMDNMVIKTGLPSATDSFDIAINEILFNPTPTGVDYVELYNRSNKILDVKELYIANRSSSGELNSIKQLTTESRLLFPNDYLVISENSMAVRKEYLVKNPEMMIELSSMPSFPNENGSCIILNKQGRIIDDLRYDSKWHFALIENPKGVALERTDFDAPTQNQSNWHSAAASAGYGTPTYQNSQFKTSEQPQGMIDISPKVFSPDNDGFDDFATINYQFSERGYVCNIYIFDAKGSPVRNLVKNGLCSQSGYFRWDGVDEQGKPLPIGNYIVVTEIFNLQGKSQLFKNVVVLARRLR